MPQRLLLEGSDIDELLERVRLEHGPDARIVHAEQKLVGGVGGFFAKRRFEVAVAVDGPASGPSSIEDLLALADAQDGAAPRPTAELLPPAPPTLDEPSAPAAHEPVRQPGRPVSTESESFDHFVRELIAQAEGGPLQPDAAAFVPSTPRVELGSARAAAPAPAAAPLELVSPSGDITETTDAITDTTDSRLALLDRLAMVAIDPPRDLRGTQVVVGPSDEAIAVARAWVSECGEDDDAVVTLSGDAPYGPVERDAVVVVGADRTPHAARAVGRRLAGLGALGVTAVVDARWDVETSRRWLDALRAAGVSVCQLAAHGVRDAADPARVLDLGLPVTWLDARPATLGTWAAPYLDRL